MTRPRTRRNIRHVCMSINAEFMWRQSRSDRGVLFSKVQIPLARYEALFYVLLFFAFSTFPMFPIPCFWSARSRCFLVFAFSPRCSPFKFR